jgi:hypothetical protein
VATAQGRLPTALDDGLLGAHRRRLLQRAAGRVLDLSGLWEPNLAAYPQSAVTALVVTGSLGGRARRAPARPVPTAVPRLDDAPLHAFDTVVAAFTLCTEAEPAAWLADAARRLAPGGQMLVLQHVGGTGLTGVIQHLTDPFSRAARTGCRLNLDVPAAARAAGLDLIDCARFRLWVASTVPVPALAGVLVPQARGAR